MLAILSGEAICSNVISAFLEILTSKEFKNRVYKSNDFAFVSAATSVSVLF